MERTIEKNIIPRIIKGQDLDRFQMSNKKLLKWIAIIAISTLGLVHCTGPHTCAAARRLAIRMEKIEKQYLEKAVKDNGLPIGNGHALNAIHYAKRADKAWERAHKMCNIKLDT